MGSLLLTKARVGEVFTGSPCSPTAIANFPGARSSGTIEHASVSEGEEEKYVPSDESMQRAANLSCKGLSSN